jgi:hypothetical protein
METSFEYDIFNRQNVIESEINGINEKLGDLSIYDNNTLINHNLYNRKQILENNLIILDKLKDLLNSIK